MKYARPIDDDLTAAFLAKDLKTLHIPTTLEGELGLHTLSVSWKIEKYNGLNTTTILDSLTADPLSELEEAKIPRLEHPHDFGFTL